MIYLLGVTQKIDYLCTANIKLEIKQKKEHIWVFKDFALHTVGREKETNLRIFIEKVI